LNKLKRSLTAKEIANMNGIKFTPEYIKHVQTQFADYVQKMIVLIKMGHIKVPHKEPKRIYN